MNLLSIAFRTATGTSSLGAAVLSAVLMVVAVGVVSVSVAPAVAEAACGDPDCCDDGLCGLLGCCGGEGERTCNVNSIYSNCGGVCDAGLESRDGVFGLCWIPASVGEACGPLGVTAPHCADGLLCETDFDGSVFSCVPDWDPTDGLPDAANCDRLYSPRLHSFMLAVDDAIPVPIPGFPISAINHDTFTSGTGAGAGLHANITEEVGVAYSLDGRFGCYHTECVGLGFVAEASVYWGQSNYQTYDDILGSSTALYVSVGSGFFAGTISTFFENDPVSGIDGLKDCAALSGLPFYPIEEAQELGSYIGLGRSFEIGIGAPVAIGCMSCETELITTVDLDDVNPTVAVCQTGDSAQICVDPGTCTANVSFGGGSYATRCLDENLNPPAAGCDGELTVTPPSGVYGPSTALGDIFYHVPINVSDPLGGSDSCTEDFVVADCQPPSITNCPPPVELECAGPQAALGGAPGATYDPPAVTAVDDCSGIDPVSVLDPGLEAYPIGKSSMPYFAVDGSVGSTEGGNVIASACADLNFFEGFSQVDMHGNSTVTVVDSAGPDASASCPPTQVVACTPGDDSGVVTWSNAPAFDACDGVSYPVTCDYPSGTAFSDGLTTVTCSATDSSGNVGSCAFNVFVTGLPPEIDCPASMNRECGLTDDDWFDFLDATISAPEACSEDFASVFCREYLVGSPTVPPVPCSFGQSWCTAVSAGGDDSHCCMDAPVVDTLAPVLSSCPDDTVLDASSPTLSADIDAFLNSAAAADACDGSIVVTNDAPATFGLGQTKVTFTAADLAGHQVSCSAKLTLTCPASITCPADATIAGGPDTQADLSNFLAGATPSPDCVTGLPLPVTDDAPAQPTIGATLIEFETTDGVENTATCNATLTTECPARPVPHDQCLSLAKAKLQWKAGSPADKSKLDWSWKKGQPFDMAALGYPNSVTMYSLCIYEMVGDSPVQTIALGVQPNAAWTSKNDKGWKYKDKAGAFRGVQKGQLKTGVLGKTGAKLKAKGADVPLPSPFDGTHYLDPVSTVRAQLIGNNGACLTSLFSVADAKRNTVDQVKLSATDTCGDGALDSESGEVCDDVGESAACDVDCTLPVCGDGVVNAASGETCDDAGDSADCNADCTLASCGDGVVNAAAGEECDDGAGNNDGAVDACRTDCLLAHCGDGVIDTGETCDDSVATPTCDTDCTPPLCGDGVTNPATGEQCDDDGPSATCNADCTLTGCGDGILNVAAGEECDDGAGNSDTIPNACRTNCLNAYCGDNVLDTGEWCDGSDLGGESCPLGGTLACHSSCRKDYTACVPFKRVFVTTASSKAAINGYTGAVNRCNVHAFIGGIIGTFLPWISDGTGNSPLNNFTQSSVPYLRMDDVRVADDWADLTDGSLQAPINLDQYGNLVWQPGEFAWTATTAAGAYDGGNTCAGFTNIHAGSVTTGCHDQFGTSSWSQCGTTSCGGTNRLYCFQQ